MANRSPDVMLTWQQGAHIEQQTARGSRRFEFEYQIALGTHIVKEVISEEIEIELFSAGHGRIDVYFFCKRGTLWRIWKS